MYFPCLKKKIKADDTKRGEVMAILYLDWIFGVTNKIVKGQRGFDWEWLWNKTVKGFCTERSSFSGAINAVSV